MLPLPAFELHHPQSLEAALAVLQMHGPAAKLIAGGTDLLPNMKHGLFTPAHVVSLSRIASLRGVRATGEGLSIGAMTTLAEVARDATVREVAPSLAEAAAHVAGPQLREMGTLGGNVCLDTRCVYYNQTHFWRRSLGYCLKKDGTVCHVVKGGQKCVAAASNDTAAALLSLGAGVVLRSPRGERRMALEAFYVADGVRNTVLEPDEVLTEIRIPRWSGRVTAGYQKLRIRAAIDYPVLSVAVAAEVDAQNAIQRSAVVVSALGARPHVVRRLENLNGRPLDAAVISEIGTLAQRQCHPLTNINVDPAWRRALIPVLVRRAFAQAAWRGEPATSPSAS